MKNFETPEYRGTTLVPMVVEQTSRGERLRHLFAAAERAHHFYRHAD
jgi:hypothetical protein